MRNAALHSPWRRLGAPLLLSTALALGGCAALGGNVRGDFSCAAPDGVCAPSALLPSANPAPAIAAPLRRSRREGSLGAMVNGKRSRMPA